MHFSVGGSGFALSLSPSKLTNTHFDFSAEGSVRSFIAITLLLAIIAIASCSRPSQYETSDVILRSADQDAANWLMYGRTYDDHRFSPLT